MKSLTSWITQTVMPVRYGGRVRNCMSLWSGGEREFVNVISGLALEKNGPCVQCFDLEINKREKIQQIHYFDDKAGKQR